MFRLLMCVVALLSTLTLSAGDAGALNGAWRGELKLGISRVPLVFNFSSDASGNTLCSIDSPAQGAKDIQAEVTFISPDSVAVTCRLIGAAYGGAIQPGRIVGRFSQRGYELPLELVPNESVAQRRPQTPVPPFPYTVVDTVFYAPDGVALSGTLTLPVAGGRQKFPAVVMVSGSGPQNRDEEVFEHKPFAVIADFLARNGIASLRYDDRGVGESGGEFGEATTYTFKDDASSAVDFLRSVNGVSRVGVLGHSEGGTIAFMIAADGNADFVVSLAGMAESGKETLLRQNSRALDKMGLAGADKKTALRLIELGFDAVVEQMHSGQRAPIDVDSLVAASGLQAPVAFISSLKGAQSGRSLWLDTMLTLNPRDYIVMVKCPVLAVGGGKDTQVSPDNLTVISECAPQAEILMAPELNHMMQHAVTGDTSEYYSIRETVSPDVLDSIVRFILGHFASEAGRKVDAGD